MNEFGVALFYDEKDRVDALETMEDLQNELQSWGFKSRKLKNNRLRCEDTLYTFVDIDDNPEFFQKNVFFNKVYISDRLKTKLEFQLNTTCEIIKTHPYPFQSLIDLVMDSKKNKNNISKKEEAYA